MAGKKGSVLGKRKATPVEEEDEEVDYSSWTVALLKNELTARGLSTTGRKALLVERLEEADNTDGGVDADAEEEGDEGQLEDYSSWTVAELKAELKVRGLPATGRKALLVERLEEADAGEDGDVEMEEEKPKPKKEKKVAPPPKKAVKKDRVMSREAAHSVVGCFADVSGAPPKVKTYKFGRASDEPAFAEPVSVVRHVVLQVTDIKNNHNKYYSMELQKSDSCGFRVYTHYGRTDDLTTNPNAGQKETRYVSSLEEAKLLYNKIYKDKTSARKGYQPVNLSSTKIGSVYVQGKSAGYVDQATKDAAESSSKGSSSPKPAKKKKAPSTLSPAVQQLVRKVYAEATQSLMSQVSVSITANGIETPLGILTIAQVEDGEYILDKIQQELARPKPRSNVLVELSGEFYTAIPHRIGRSQASIAAAVIRTEDAYKAKTELMQLMKDMLEVCEEEGSVLFDDDVESKYKALNCGIERLDPSCDEYSELMDFLSISQTRGMGNYGDKAPKANGKVSYRILDIYKVKKSDAEGAYTKKIQNRHFLYHGSRMCNWMGLLSRGILMPNAVTKLGIPRTDFGWLGAGIYFGDCYQTSAQYCIAGQDGSSMAMICEVALGKMHEQAQIDGKITAPPSGYDSIHGNPSLPHSGFADHEYCIYSQAQQTPRYLINFRR